MLKFQLFFITVTISRKTKKEIVSEIEHERLIKQVIQEVQTKRDQFPFTF